MKAMACILCSFVVLGTALGGTTAGENKAIILYLEPDGSYRLEGVRYTAADMLVRQLEQVERRLPQSNVTIVVRESTRQEAITRTVELLRKAGIPRIGLLIEPDNSN